MSNVFQSGVSINALAGSTGQAYINFQLSGQNDWTIFTQGDSIARVLDFKLNESENSTLRLTVDGLTLLSPLIGGTEILDLSNSNGNIRFTTENGGLVFNGLWFQNIATHINSVAPMNHGMVKITNGATGFCNSGNYFIQFNTDLVTGQITGTLRPFLPVGTTYAFENRGTGYPLTILSGQTEVLRLQNLEGNTNSATIIKASDGWRVIGSNRLGSYLMI